MNVIFHAHLKVSAGHGDVLEKHGLPVVQIVLGVVLAPAHAAEAVHLRHDMHNRGRKSQRNQTTKHVFIHEADQQIKKQHKNKALKVQDVS